MGRDRYIILDGKQYSNLDYQNLKIYNGYNYGSYLLFNDIPVFDMQTDFRNSPTEQCRKHKYDHRNVEDQNNTSDQ